MRLVLLVVGVFFAAIASAHDDPADIACQAEPTQLCVLETAVRASRAAAAAGSTDLPFEMIVRVAARAGHLDLALSLADDLNKDSGMAITELLTAAAWEDRLQEVAPLLLRVGQSEGDYPYAIAPVYAAQGREADLAALIEKAIWKPSPDQLKSWRIEGELRAGRPERAVRMLRQMLDKQRTAVVLLVVKDLEDNYNARLARSLVPLLDNSGYQFNRKVYIANATADIELARSLDEARAGMTPEDRYGNEETLAYALAKGGDWERAVEIVTELDAGWLPVRLAWIAESSREPKVVRMARNALAGVTDAGARDDIIQTLIRALVLTGREDEAQRYVELGDQWQRPQRQTMVVMGLALAGRPTDALVAARSIDDPGNRAHAIAMIAWYYGNWPL